MKLFLAFSLVLTSYANSAKILGIFHMATHSHFAPGQKLMNALVDRGHDVSVIAAFDRVSPKIKLIHLTDFEQETKEISRTLLKFTTVNWFQHMAAFHSIGGIFARKTLMHPNIQNLIKSNQTYDVIIIERFGNEAFEGLCHHFKSACIIYAATSSTYWLNMMVRNPENPSYMPQWFSGEAHPMDFWSRLRNTAVFIAETIYFNLIHLPEQNAIMQKYIPDVPHLNDIFYKPDLIVLNSHISFSDALPHLPNMLEIGGFHVDLPGTLPKDLKKFLDDASDGVVYFSMGSILQFSTLPTEVRDELKKAFSKLKQRVLWKSDIEIHDLPVNVKALKWIPQTHVLAHPNVKVFMTHGGLFSIIESVYFGVPLIGIPIFADQLFNVMKFKYSGLGTVLHYNNLTVANILKTIKMVIENPIYSENAKKSSRLIRDRPMNPIDTFVYWVEHVVRHRGGKHLKSFAVDLTWYQYILLDIAAFVLALVVLSSLVIVCLLRILRQMLLKKRSDVKEKTS